MNGAVAAGCRTKSAGAGARVLVIDDHAIFRTGLSKVLQELSEVAAVDETGDWRQGLARIEAGAIDLLLLDINLPDRSGLDLLGLIHARFPALQIIMLSMYSEPQYALRALRNGAQGYVAKDMEVSDLIAAIRSVRRGRKFVTPSIAEALLGNTQDHALAPNPHQRLSAREAQVLDMIVAGDSLTAIAERLAINVKTVGTYRRRILDKLGLASNAQLVQYAVHHRLVD
ncbi:MAG TPA: response regulator transcription factor [Ottowia sp.]|uniref:response regulator transcription factor n=1 Tax=Ottowia sp. TaxID=1898956 RepID=UPI002CE1B1A8|nr:response regulator transcription factor [Ottowia sp.]HMN22804.1 response regulator transcription factor [Ottowia sp.]